MAKEQGRVKRRERKNITSGVAHVNASFNNTMITITDAMATGQGGGHVQSVILASILLTLAALLGVLGVVGELVAVNRKLLERINVRVQRIELELASGANGR